MSILLFARIRFHELNKCGTEFAFRFHSYCNGLDIGTIFCDHLPYFLSNVNRKPGVDFFR